MKTARYVNVFFSLWRGKNIAFKLVELVEKACGVWYFILVY
ncbi:hypothetical protein [Helicobacter pylori]|nr:hypothetical protein [Helicobacter pylori]